jgi:hypothetical protein
MANFISIAESANLDFEARLALNRWGAYAERGRNLQAEPATLKLFQPEPEVPAEVGMHELISDEFTPEELVEMFNREPLVIDWDEHQEKAYA